MLLIIGDIIIPAIGVIQIIKNAIYKIFSLFLYQALAFSGNNAIKIFDPSNGGNGIKLNTPNPTFIIMQYFKICANANPTWFVNANTVPYLIYNPNIIENTNANMKFIIGPANDTNAFPFFIDIVLLKLFGFISTGLPHPNPDTNNNIVPYKSKCFKGFNVNLPCLLGVSSPNFSATNACAYSWKVIATNSPGIDNSNIINFVGDVKYSLKITLKEYQNFIYLKKI